MKKRDFNNKYGLICAVCISVCTICIALLTSVVIFVKTVEQPSFDERMIYTVELPSLADKESEKVKTVKKHVTAKINDSYKNVDNINEIIDTVIDKAKKYDISWTTAFSIIEMESCFNYKAARNGKGNDVSKGLTQITPLCLEEYNKRNNNDYVFTDMQDIEKSIEVGFWYLRFLLDKYDHILSEADAIIAYNVGPSKLKRMSASDKTTYNVRRNKIYNKWNNIFSDMIFS